MKTIHFYGKRGMGDIVATLSYFLKTAVKSDCHLIFHYPPDHGYENLIPDIMKSFARQKHTVTYEVMHDWFSIKENHCIDKFGTSGLYQHTDSEHNYVWWFTGTFYGHRYFPYRAQWKGDVRGHIALVCNNEFADENHPLKDKFFSEEQNNYLKSLVDNKTVFALGMHNTYEENVSIIRRARFVLGVEGGWTHVSNAMNAPFIIVRNKRTKEANIKVHKRHPRLKVIDSDLVNYYLNLTETPADLAAPPEQ